MIAIGVPEASSKLGAVRVYRYETEWNQVGQVITGESFEERCGSPRTVSISATGNMLAIGTQYNDANGTDSGKVRIYTIE
jgi:hypothetical protein